MYLDYFSLLRHPFRITPDTSLFYEGGAEGRGVILDAMLYAIETGEGILKVVGEVGSGKTMLCRMLEERLPETTEVVYLANPNLSAEDILYAIAFDLKLPIRRDTTKLLVMQQLQDYLLDQHGKNRKVLVIIEEAQGMPLETLEEIRLFSNLETNRDKLLQIILFGQPELDKNLSAKHIRQLRERITHSFYLSPLSREQAEAYIRFRLDAAGCPCPRLFTPGALWLLSRASGGLTRRINILADKALLAAFADNVLESPENLSPDVPPVVTWRHVMAAIRDSEYSSFALKSFTSSLKIAGASALAVIAVLSIAFWPATAGQAKQVREEVIPIEAPLLAVEPEQAPVDVQPPLVSVRSLAIDLPEQAPAVAAVAVQASAPASRPELETVAEPVSTGLAVVEDPQRAVETAPVVEAGADKVEAVAEVTEVAVAEAARPDQHWPASQDKLPALDGILDKQLAQQRLQPSIDWLMRADPDSYTIQFMSGDMADMSSAENFLAELQSAELLEDSYVCMSVFEGKSYWTIKHGVFPGLSVAQNYINELPPRFFDFQPFVQNISSVECNANNSLAALIME
jgi:type II secretory pathway predicted ATPase ExeA/septal ring-binding cell division protein DamX